MHLQKIEGCIRRILAHLCGVQVRVAQVAAAAVQRNYRDIGAADPQISADPAGWRVRHDLWTRRSDMEMEME